MSFRALRIIAVVMLCSTSRAQTTFTWNNAAGGTFGTPANWTPAGPPSLSTHIALFNLNNTYAVTLGANHSFGTLLMNNGTVTFNAAGRTMTLSGDWQQTQPVTFNGGTLSIGVGGDLEVVDAFNAATGSFVRADQLFCGQGGTGTMTFTAATLNCTGVLPHYVGWNTSSFGRLRLTSNSVGTINGGLALVEPGQQAGGVLSVTSGSDLTVGTLSIGQTTSFTNSFRGFAEVIDPGSTIVQTGASGMEIGGGSLTFTSFPPTIIRPGILSVGTAGQFTTGTGLTNINAGGLFVGTGSFIANGDVTLTQRGICTVAAGGTFILGASRTLTVQGLSVEIIQVGIDDQLVNTDAFSSSGFVSGGSLTVRGLGALEGAAQFTGTTSFNNVTVADTSFAQLITGGAFSAGTLVAGAGAAAQIYVQGGSFNSSSLVTIGSSSFGLMQISGNRPLNTTSFRIGEGTTGIGLVVDDGGTFNNAVTWNNTGSLVVGGGGIGTLNFAGPLGPPTSTISTGALFVGEQFGGVGSLLLGPNNVTISSGSIVIGQGGAGTAILSGDARMVCTGSVSIGNSFIGSGYLRIGGGTPTIDGALDATARLVTLGLTGQGTLDLRNHGTAGIGTLQIGATAGLFSGDGTMLVSGGTLAVGNTFVGSGSGGGFGTMAVSGGAVSGGTIVVNTDGFFTMSGGTLSNIIHNNNAATISGGTASGTIINNRNFTVSGGTISNVVTNNATFTYSGGVITGTLNNNQRLNLQTLLPPGTGVINNNATGIIVPSGLAIGGAGTINNFGSFSGSGTFLAGTVVNNHGSLAASGGELVIAAGATFNNGSTGLIRNSPLATLRVQTTAFTNAGSVEVNAGGGVQTATGLLIASAKQLSMKGGVLATTGNTTISTGASLVGYGQLNTNLINNGSVLFNGPVNLQGNLTNNAAGTVTVRNANTIVYGNVTNSGTITASNGTIVFEGSFAPPAITSLDDNAGVDGAGVVAIGAGGRLITGYVRQGTLSLAGTDLEPALAIMRPRTAGGSLSVVNNLTIAPNTSGGFTGQLDLADANLVIDYTGASPITTVRNQIRSGWHNGAWNGNGIISSLANASQRAVGVADNATLGLTTFSGQAIDSTSVLLKYTYYGDSNLDGQVDVTDLGALATHWQSSADWTGGDFNYDGFVDVTDLGALATNWQQGVGSPLDFGELSRAAPSRLDNALSSLGLVPEPLSTVTYVTILILRLLPRRRSDSH